MFNIPTIPISNDAVFEQAVCNYPECEFKRNLKKTKETIEKDAGNDPHLLSAYRNMQSDPDNTKRFFVFMRFANPICFWCSNRNGRKLHICDGCKLVHYCNDRCKRLDAPFHRVWCRQVPNVKKPRKDCPHILQLRHNPHLPSSNSIDGVVTFETSNHTVFDHKQDRRLIHKLVRTIIKKIIADNSANEL